MQRKPSSCRLVFILLLLCNMAAVGCDTRDPTGAAGRTPPPLRADTYGPPVMLASFDYQARCSTENLYWGNCEAQPDSLVAVLPAGRHRLGARISGWIEFYGSSGPAPHCSRVGPLGLYQPLLYSYFLRTEVYWTAPRASSVLVPLQLVGTDSSVAEGTVDVPAGGAVYIRRGSGGIMSSYCHMVSPPPTVEITAQEIFDEQSTVVLSCQGDLGPGRVTRDSTVRCEARKEPSSAPDSLQILGWSFENRARMDGDIHATEWEGRMASSGTVTLRAALGAQDPITRTVRIQVVNRVWPELEIRSINRVIMVDPQSMADYPPRGSAFGRHELGKLDFDHMQFTHPESGPNAGVFFLHAPMEILPSTIYLHPALYVATGLPSNLGTASSGYADWLSWSNDQNGHGSGNCGASDVAVFAGNVERHEGVTLAANSHVGVANRSFMQDNVQDRMERIVSQTDTGDVKFRISVQFRRLTDDLSSYHQRQVAFDTLDTPKVYAIGCTFDSNRNDN